MVRSAVDFITLLSVITFGLKGNRITGTVLEFPFVQFIIDDCMINTCAPLDKMFSFFKTSFMAYVPYFNI